MSTSGYVSSLPSTGFEEDDPILEALPEEPEPTIETEPPLEPIDDPESEPPPVEHEPPVEEEPPPPPVSDAHTPPPEDPPPPPVEAAAPSTTPTKPDTPYTEPTVKRSRREEDSFLEMVSTGAVSFRTAVGMTRKTDKLQYVSLRRLLEAVPSLSEDQVATLAKVAFTGEEGRGMAKSAKDETIDLIEKALPDPARLWSPSPGWPWH